VGVELHLEFVHNAVDMNSPQKGIKSPAALRALGVVLVVLGGALMAGMAVLSWIMYGVINNSDPRASTKFTGSESDMMFMFAVFALVFFIGLTAFVAGLWQVIFGKRNLILVWIMLGLGGIFFVLGTAVRYLN
jgi:magnesium-transporting ATPase (P-type)